jgi:leucyl aminopeptidase (aminopeptidase T)
LEQGIAADYSVVHKKGNKIKEILENSDKIEITSDLGTDLTFSIYTDKIFSRSPIFVTEERYWNQAPEGEVMSCPIESTFNGRMVVDGVVTAMGEVPTPIIWDFKDGIVANVKGDENFLKNLLKLLQQSDKRMNSLIGIWIAELSIGSNEWAVYDDNISNCEKVAGGIHLAMGKTAGGIGVDRGETYHFDNIIKESTLIVKMKNGEQTKILEAGKLLI